MTSTNDQARGVAVQPDGRIVVAGGAGGGFGLARYLPDGSLDGSFSDNGSLITPVESYGSPFALAVQPDGKIVVAGYSDNGLDTSFAIVRYLTNGTLDSSFADDGIQTTPVAFHSRATSLALQPDGKIVVGGWSYYASGGPTNDFALVRYNGNGTLDTTFSGDGVQTTNFGQAEEVIEAVGLQPDGKIVAAGTANDPVENDIRFAVLRYTSDGILDTTFSGDGIQTTPIRTTDLASAMLIQPDGMIVVGGTSNGDGLGDADFAVVRYKSDGGLDPGFSEDGIQVTPVGDLVDILSALSLQPDGKIVAAGSASRQFALVRYNADGSLDETFSADGKQTTSVGSHGCDAFAVALQFDGKIVAAGWSDDQTGFNADFALVRYVGSATAPPLTRPGIVRYNNWHLNTNFDTGIDMIEFSYGKATDYKVVGDWDGSKTTSPGVVRGNVWYLNNAFDSGSQVAVFPYGKATDTKIVGDWDGDGDFTPGVVRGNVWYLNNDLASSGDISNFGFGKATDTKIVGDWDGDGDFTPGVVRGADWYLSNAGDGTSSIPHFSFGDIFDVKIVGGWEG